MKYQIHWHRYKTHQILNTLIQNTRYAIPHTKHTNPSNKYAIWNTKYHNLKYHIHQRKYKIPDHQNPEGGAQAEADDHIDEHTDVEHLEVPEVKKRKKIPWVAENEKEEKAPGGGKKWKGGISLAILTTFTKIQQVKIV